MFVLAKEKDHEAILALLKKQSDLNLFFIGDIEMYGWEKGFLQVWVDDTPVLHTVALRYYSNMLVYSDDCSFSAKEFLKLIKDNGSKHFSCGRQCYEHIKDYFPTDVLTQPCTMAKLTKVAPFAAIGLPRPATKEESRQVAESMSSIVEFASSTDEPIDVMTSHIEKKVVEDPNCYFVIKEDGKVVASANTSAASSLSAMICGVFTLTGYRGKGYATSVVGSMCQSLLDRGKTPILFFDNPKAASIYHRLGFVDFDEWFMMSFKNKRSLGTNP